LENVLIKDVAPASNGFFDITFGDDRVVATRKKELADKAKLNIGEVVAVSLTEKVNGQFTNIYLNSIASADPEAPAPSDKPHPSVKKDDAKIEWQARRWAYSTALELGVASGEVGFPPDEEQWLKIKLVAETVLGLSRVPQDS